MIGTPWRCRDLRRHVIDNAIANIDFTFADLFQTSKQAQVGRFSAARRPDKNHELFVSNVEIHVFDDFDITKSFVDRRSCKLRLPQDTLLLYMTIQLLTSYSGNLRK